MESDHHISSSPDCRNTADVPSFPRRTALSAMHLSRIDKVLKCGDSMINLHMFDLCDGSKNLDKLFSVSCETFVLHGQD